MNGTKNNRPGLDYYLDSNLNHVISRCMLSVVRHKGDNLPICMIGWVPTFS